MSTKKLVSVLLAATLISASGWVLAAEGDASSQHHAQSEQGMKAMPGMSGRMMGNMGGGMMGHGMMGHGMMGNGMMGGMMGMMGGGCPMMGRFPAGNEALAMRMHGEMMEAMGKILVKYADKMQPQQSK
ncbi:MAG TPA: hypothetical protein VFM11_00785 [Burkholderiales bacterium]|nr:hypothetical protein [Burkholderiales bacterium]